MDIHELKENLANLLIDNLEMLGVPLETIDLEDAVKLYSTSDEYCQERNESTWISSVSTDDQNFMIIAQGTPYDKEAIEETGREVEVGRVLIDDTKAEMLVDALLHSFPEKVYERIGSLDEDEAEIEDIDEHIGDLKKEIAALQLLRKKKNLKRAVDSDQCIDVYTKLKTYAGTLKKSVVEPEIIKRKDTVLFISSFKDDKIVKLTEGNVSNIVREQTQNMPAKKITKTILINKKIARVLAEAITKTFTKNVTH